MTKRVLKTYTCTIEKTLEVKAYSEEEAEEIARNTDQELFETHDEIYVNEEADEESEDEPEYVG